MPTHERPIRAMTAAMRCISAFAAGFTAAFVSSFDKGR